MQIYFTGKSFRNVMSSLQLRGTNIGHVAVYKWIKKYVKLTPGYVGKLKLPMIGIAWRKS
jgi:hypothetical protein